MPQSRSVISYGYPPIAGVTGCTVNMLTLSISQSTISTNLRVVAPTLPAGTCGVKPDSCGACHTCPDCQLRTTRPIRRPVRRSPATLTLGVASRVPLPGGAWAPDSVVNQHADSAAMGQSCPHGAAPVKPTRGDTGHTRAGGRGATRGGGRGGGVCAPRRPLAGPVGAYQGAGGTRVLPRGSRPSTGPVGGL